MNTVLRQFLRAHCIESSAARTQVVDLLAAFRESLPAADRDAWTRDRVVSELIAANFTLGRDQKVSWVAGLALRGQWTARAGGELHFERA
jgi:hypothetical protein